MRWIAALACVALPAAADPPPELRCYFGSTHAHCWFPTGGDDGGYRLEVTRKQRPGRTGGPAYRAWRAAHPELFRGGRAKDAFRYAADVGGLDFLALTIHNHMATAAEYDEIRREAAAINARRGGRFCALFGQEWSTISSGNHVNVLGAGAVCEVAKGDYKTLFESWLPAHGAPVVVLNHPLRPRRRSGTLDRARAALEYGADDYGGDAAAHARAAAPYVRLIEVISGPGHGRLDDFRRWRGRPAGFFRWLNQGFRIAPCAGSDNHYQNWGTSSPARTGLWARSLAPADVLAAMRDRRAFATEDRNLSVWLEVAGAPLGAAIVSRARTASVLLRVEDADEPDARYQLRLLVDRDGVGGDEARVVHERFAARAGVHRLAVPLPARATYVLAHVVQMADEDAAWTAPVWVDRPETPQ